MIASTAARVSRGVPPVLISRVARPVRTQLPDRVTPRATWPINVAAWVGLLLALAPLVTSAQTPPDRRVVEAVKSRDLSAVASLLRGRVNVDVPDTDGATALAWAAHWDDLETARLLLGAGADANAANEYGVTPLSLACTNRNAAMVDALLAAGANANASLPSGETVLMTCARTGRVEAVTALLARGANVNAAERWQGQTALMWAVSQRHAGVAKLLIARGADVRARSKGGFTALLFAAQQGDVESARSLLDAGASIEDATPRDGTALVVAAASGQEAMSLLLLEKGANARAVDRSGRTALHFAAVGRSLPLLKALAEHGADLNARLTRNVPGAADVNTTGATPFFMAAAALNGASMRALAAAGADGRIPTADNTNALMVAAGVGRYEERNAVQYKAALDAVTVAFEQGIDVNAVGANGWTALHGASYTGADAIIRFLVQKGGRMDVKDTFGQTPLSIAEAVITSGLKDFADVRPRKLRTSTAALLVELGSPSLEDVGIERLGSMAVVPK